MAIFQNNDGKHVLLKMVKCIQDNKAYLGEVDGLIGDGDHGMNMNKGFTLFETRYRDRAFTFTEGLSALGDILFSEIGGSMGPIYGTVFTEIAQTGTDLKEIKLVDLYNMLAAGLKGLQEIVEAQVGDKTLVDTLSPAIDSLKHSTHLKKDYEEALELMKSAAHTGKESTKDMMAKFGRSSRLGERSRGVLDAGAVSCCLLLTSMADGIKDVLV